MAHLALGALFFLVAASFWNSRAHIEDVIRKAFRGAPEVDDSGELLSYRTAVFGAIAGFLLCLFWLYATGMNLLTSFVFLLSALIIFVGLARIVSQTGLAYGRATVCTPVFTVNALGTSLVGPASLTGLGLNFALSADVRTFVMASAATGLKLAEVTSPGASAAVLGHRRRHPGHPDRLCFRRHQAGLHLRGHQPGRLAVHRPSILCR